MKKPMILLALCAAALTFTGCGQQSVNESEFESEEVAIEPYRQRELTHLAREAASRHYWNEVAGRDMGEWDKVTIEIGESEYFDSVYQSAREAIHKEQYPAISKERRVELEKEGRRDGKASYESNGMHTRQTYLWDVLPDYLLGEQEILLKAFDKGFAEARDAENARKHMAHEKKVARKSKKQK